MALALAEAGADSILVQVREQLRGTRFLYGQADG